MWNCVHTEMFAVLDGSQILQVLQVLICHRVLSREMQIIWYRAGRSMRYRIIFELFQTRDQIWLRPSPLQ